MHVYWLYTKLGKYNNFNVLVLIDIEAFHDKIKKMSKTEPSE